MRLKISPPHVLVCPRCRGRTRVIAAIHEAIEISCESFGNDCASGNKCPPKK